MIISVPTSQNWCHRSASSSVAVILELCTAAACSSCPGDFDVDWRRLECFSGVHSNALLSSFALGLDGKLELFQLVFSTLCTSFNAGDTWSISRWGEQLYVKLNTKSVKRFSDRNVCKSLETLKATQLNTWRCKKMQKVGGARLDAALRMCGNTWGLDSELSSYVSVHTALPCGCVRTATCVIIILYCNWFFFQWMTILCIATVTDHSQIAMMLVWFLSNSGSQRKPCLFSV